MFLGRLDMWPMMMSVHGLAPNVGCHPCPGEVVSTHLIISKGMSRAKHRLGPWSDIVRGGHLVAAVDHGGDHPVTFREVNWHGSAHRGLLGRGGGLRTFEQGLMIDKVQT